MSHRVDVCELFESQWTHTHIGSTTGVGGVGLDIGREGGVVAVTLTVAASGTDAGVDESDADFATDGA